MSVQPREYFMNGKSILLNKYQDVENAKNDQDIDVNSGLYQSSMNQTGNQFQESNRYNNQTQLPINPNSNNYINQSGELNSLYSPNSNNMNSPTQNFDTNTNFNNTNGFQTQKNFYNTDGQNYMNPNNDYNDVGARTNYNKGYYPYNQNMNSQTQNGMTEEMRKNLERLVENLYDYYYSTKGFFQNDPKLLIEFYWEYKRRFIKKVRISEKIKELMYYREEDVEKCINDYLNNIKDRMKNASTYYNSTTYNSKVKKSSSVKPGQKNINNKCNYTFTKDTLRRLYPKQEEMEKRERDKLNCDDFNSFFTKLLNYYQNKNNYKLTNNKDELIEFWQNIENKEKLGLQWENGENDLIEEMELFFNDEEIIQRLSDIFYRHTKLRTYHPRPLHDFWAKDLTEINRYYSGLNKYSKDDLYLLLEKYYKQINEEKKDKMDKLENEKREKERKEIMEKKREMLEKKEEREKRINELAEPKDRYKTGRVMCELQKQFKYDNIIKKMIKNEFKDNKIFKFPEEYAVRDEDEQKDILFKHDLEKGAIVKNNDEKIKQQIEEAYDEYNYKKDKNRPKREKRIEERKQLFQFIKEKVKEYYKKMSKRLDKDEKGIESINIFLNNMYKEMSRKHRNATKLYFKRPRCEVLKKTYKYKKNHTFYPRKLKYYFFRLLRRIGTDNKGRIVFAKNDNLPFWSPSLSNNCKVHGNNCPIYCCHNTHNNMIKELRDKNFNTNFNIKKNKKKLVEKETLNLWKRPDLKKDKEKIFMCFDDAEHCTFEPKLVKKENEMNEMEKDEIINSRLNNMKWVNDMGQNFTTVRGTIYKEGILKRAKIFFADGRYENTIKELKKAFDLEAIKIFKKNGEYKPKQKENNNDNRPRSVFDRKRNENEPTEDFKNEKNLQLIDEVYFMLKNIEVYRKRQKSQSKKLEKEIDMFEYNKQFVNNKRVNSRDISSNPDYSDKNPQFVFVKDKYFNCKNEMCPLKEKCPNLDPKSKEQCKYAHQISELKFNQQMRENIKLRKNLLTTLTKGQEPNMKYEWVPTGPLVSCIGCGMTFNDVKRVHTVEVSGGGGGVKSAGKGICGFCQYNKRNDKQYEINKRATIKKNKIILEKREKRLEKEKQEKLKSQSTNKKIPYKK